MPDLLPPDDDGLYIPEVGPWSRDKHHFLARYLNAFTIAMHDKWGSLHYIDLFAGAGIEHLAEHGKSYGLDWGSPLIAAQATRKFDRLHLCESDTERFGPLKARIDRFPQPETPQILNEDANLCVDQIARQIQPNDLCLAFLDPFGLTLKFETLRKLSQRKMDFIIFFPDHLDMLRNWKMYSGVEESNLDQFLGRKDWREKITATHPDKYALEFANLYQENIKTLGYQHFDSERIFRTDGRALYKLIFCSRHKLGADIWRRISTTKPDNQRGFDFGG